MTVGELWWLVDAHKPVKMYGNMTENEVAAIYEATYGAIDNG